MFSCLLKDDFEDKRMDKEGLAETIKEWCIQKRYDVYHPSSYRVRHSTLHPAIISSNPLLSTDYGDDKVDPTAVLKGRKMGDVLRYNDERSIPRWTELEGQLYFAACCGLCWEELGAVRATRPDRGGPIPVNMYGVKPYGEYPGPVPNAVLDEDDVGSLFEFSPIDLEMGETVEAANSWLYVETKIPFVYVVQYGGKGIVLPEGPYFGFGSVIALGNKCNALVNTPENRIARLEREYTEEEKISGHMLYALSANTTHFKWYMHELLINLETKSSIYNYAFVTPDRGIFHTRKEYRMALFSFLAWVDGKMSSAESTNYNYALRLI